MWGRHCLPILPEQTYNFDTNEARMSLRKLAALEPAAVWPGHGRGIVGQVRRQLETAAESR
jgi:glyoxylase-like metal-dependent hydrolase (beta-lactamase superfamily II)